jgi:hypothetical protein
MAAINFRRARTPQPNSYETYISNNTATWPSLRRAFFVAIEFQSSNHRLPLPRFRQRRAIHRQLRPCNPASICSGLPRPQQRVPRRRNQTQLCGRGYVLRHHRRRFHVADRFHGPGIGRIREVSTTAGKTALENERFTIWCGQITLRGCITHGPRS